VDNLETGKIGFQPAPQGAADKIDKLLGKKTTYDIYHYPEKRYHKAEPSDYLERSPSNPRNNLHSLVSISDASASPDPAATSALRFDFPRQALIGPGKGPA